MTTPAVAPRQPGPPPAWLVTALLATYVVLAGVPSMLPLGWLARGAQAGDLLAGVAGLLAVAVALGLDLRAARGALGRGPRVVALAGAAAIYVSLEAVTIDVMNFRHYWAAALLASARPLARGVAVPGSTRPRG